MPDTTPFGDPTTDILDLSIASSVPNVTDVGYYYRQIADLPVAHVTIEEDHDDELIITQHPVEFGAIISDHAYKKPSEVRVRCAWNNSASYRTVKGGGAQPVLEGYEGYARAIYADILSLQLSRKPFSVITGKRIYNDMLIANIRVHTAPGSEYALMADIVLREVILVATKTINVFVEDSRMPNSAPQTNQGQQEAQPVQNVAAPIAAASGVPNTDENAP
jgi:hypothetical protein